MIMAECGMRVVRGVDWKWKDQDNGEGSVGTIVEIGKNGSNSSPDKTVVVHWDCSTRTNYRTGYQGFYDLRLIENATIGVRHTNILCKECTKSVDESKQRGIEGMRFKCIKCPDVNLCIECYMMDKHDINHSFLRFVDSKSSGVKVGKRTGAVKKIAKGVFPGARVVRGIDWDWGDQDGKQEGTVIDIRGWESESSRSVANVKWDNDVTNVYRMGHKAKVDLTCIKEAPWIDYYPSHLPSVGDIRDDLKSSSCRFQVGNQVRVDLDIEVLKMMQDGHGGWNPRMGEYLGKVGIVHRITDKGDIRVQYPDIQNRWTFHPDALTLVSVSNRFKTNDVVEINNDMRIVKQFQKGHGEWTDQMIQALGKRGRVLKVYADGDLRVKVDDQNWTFNPSNVKLVKLDESVQQDRCSETSSHGEMALREKFFKAISSSNIAIIRDITQQSPNIVNSINKNSNTPLHEVSITGNVEICSLLLEAGADVNKQNEEGSTPLHLALYNSRLEICQILLDKNAALDKVNKEQSTPLHIAVEKNSPDLVRILVDKFPKAMNMRDGLMNTPLHNSLMKDYRKIANFLLAQQCADMSLSNQKNFNSLHISSLKGNITATKTICEHKPVLLNKQKDDGFTPLHLASLNGHFTIVEFLVQKGADIKIENKKKQNALMLACSQGHIKVAHFLITNGASIDEKDDRGDTCLHMALNSQSQQKMNSLRSNVTTDSWMKLKDDLNLSDYSGPENLLLACYLVKNGCNLDVKNSSGHTPMHKLNEKSQKIISKYAKVCRICEETRPDVTLEPCNHKITCFDCSKKLKTCLECHVKITSKVHDNLEREMNENIDYYKEKIRSLEDTITCNICMEREKNITFMCGHQACSICSTPLKSCHICRKPITKKINTF
ncbi:DgyrCDS10668 [Dimorphilus gyrociliatus]|uniref:RING-type E3 ubiquitin transferase n=1 Tax=Dimorphilus gyrociliatus TaxID=2664684 RepID=A0A7I8W2V6_9ANNE|nr:DgyrCDS10668 [Dimorphilus gyrociliatus]